MDDGRNDIKSADERILNDGIGRYFKVSVRVFQMPGILMNIHYALVSVESAAITLWCQIYPTSRRPRYGRGLKVRQRNMKHAP
jgi:hypothetical protein